jgi:hypothetical protein
MRADRDREGAGVNREMLSFKSRWAGILFFELLVGKSLYASYRAGQVLCLMYLLISRVMLLKLPPTVRTRIHIRSIRIISARAIGSPMKTMPQ